jgi:hypothetical protein
MFGDTPRTPSAVFAAQRLSNHAVNAKVFFVEFPVVNELSHSLSLLVPAGQLGYVARIFDHGNYIKVCDREHKDGKKDVQDRMC